MGDTRASLGTQLHVLKLPGSHDSECPKCHATMIFFCELMHGIRQSVRRHVYLIVWMILDIICTKSSIQAHRIIDALRSTGPVPSAQELSGSAGRGALQRGGGAALVLRGGSAG